VNVTNKYVRILSRCQKNSCVYTTYNENGEPGAISIYYIFVTATLGIGTAVLDAAALSFLGLGAQPPEPEWGQMLSEARQYVFTVPHMVFFPGLAIMLTVLGFNLLGDGMRDALDPRLEKER
jgi:ABC-type dipeptide/oligopeptide/nickel transport system permease subunit